MKYEVINETCPEKHMNCLSCKVRKWHSFISSAEVIKEYLSLSTSKTKDGKLEIYEAIKQANGECTFVRLSKNEQDRLWKAVKIYRADQKLREAENEVGEKYSEYFVEPPKVSPRYRD